MDWFNGDEIERLNMDKEDGRIPESNPQMEYDRPFTKQEALRAKSAMALAKAGGGEDIPLALLAELPDNTTTSL